MTLQYIIFKENKIWHFIFKGKLEEVSYESFEK